MRIELLGAAFNIKTDEDPEYLEEVVAVYRSKIEEIRAGIDTSDPLKTAILAGILTADDYLKQTGARRTNASEAAQITIELIDELDAALGEGSPGTTPAFVNEPDPGSSDGQSE